MSISLPITSGTIGNLTQLTVDARALHSVLEVKCDFSSWIKRRISKYSFKENEDFEVFIKSEENPLGGRAAIEYRLSIDMGKELAMVENNERGRMVRRYFIECERRLLETPAPALPALSTVEGRRTLNSLVREWAALSGQSYPDCWAEVHVAFDVAAIADLPSAKVKQAEAWVTARIRECTKPAPAPTFRHELANFGNVNVWDELKEAERILKKCSGGIALACNSGCSMYMTPEKHLFHRILTQSADHAAASVMMALQAVATCLSVKSEVDFFKV